MQNLHPSPFSLSHTSTHKDTSPRIHSHQSPCAAVGHTPPRSYPDFDPARIWVECVWTDKGGLCGWGVSTAFFWLKGSPYGSYQVIKEGILGLNFTGNLCDLFAGFGLQGEGEFFFFNCANVQPHYTS